MLATESSLGYQPRAVQGQLNLHIEMNREPKCSARDATAIVEMIAAVFESHRLSRPVELPLRSRVNPLGLLPPIFPR